MWDVPLSWTTACESYHTRRHYSLSYARNGGGRSPRRNPQADPAVPCCAVQRESSRKRHEAEAQSEKKNAVSEWLELLCSQDDGAWKEHLIGMGSAPHVPKLFHHNGKVRATSMELKCKLRLEMLTDVLRRGLGWYWRLAMYEWSGQPPHACAHRPAPPRPDNQPQPYLCWATLCI